jgi:hypothetical protein
MEGSSMSRGSRFQSVVRPILALAVLLVASSGGTAAGAATPGVAWVADAEQPVEREWGGLSCVSIDRVGRVESPLAQGTRAYEVTVSDGDYDGEGEERCELTQGDSFRLPATPIPIGQRKFGQGDERWIAFQARVGNDWDADTALFNNFMQLKNDGSGGPPLKMAIDQGRMELGGIDRTYQSAPNYKRLWTTPFTPAMRNRWLKLMLHVRFEPNRTGFVELYGDLNGAGLVPLLARTRTPTMKRDGLVPIPTHPRIGIYRHEDVSGTARIWFDGYTVAETREAAEAVAFAAGEVRGSSDAGRWWGR